MRVAHGRVAYEERGLDDLTSLSELLEQRAAAHPDRTAFRFLSAGGDEESVMTYTRPHDAPVR